MHVVERYGFYRSAAGGAVSAALALGKALPHAAIRLHWFAEASGYRYYVLWYCTGMPYERLLRWFHDQPGAADKHPLRCAHLCCRADGRRRGGLFEEWREVGREREDPTPGLKRARPPLLQFKSSSSTKLITRWMTRF